MMMHNHYFVFKPDAGSMKGLAFALDPDGYWIEIVKVNHAKELTMNVFERGGYDDNATVWKKSD